MRIAAVAAVLTLAACGRGADNPAEGAAGDRPEAAGYLSPPVAAAFAGGLLSGSGAPGARVRLASPGGAAQFAEVASDGRWTFRPPPAQEPRIYGLSMTSGGRTVQAQGYVLVSPRGQAALLRAGGGSRRLDRQAAGLGAFDYDRGGGAVISGAAPAGAVVLVRLDGRQVAEGRADAAGRFTIALPPIGGGGHRLEVQGDGFEDEASVDTRPAEPLVGGPLRSQFSGAGLRADWLTPGGGVQTTVLID
ncbi:Ig-like domain-containing protein [Phenylobacterium sp. J367]|uniref:Ig-like domain-containing protein n=1 Tax=Phenylobacterium sp. J367 TaxID=2898435 RepID=UPI002150D91D|nr:Ig-like domain-containing protein [Phenylobacterium sp. J367]MCR5879942.1 Ig-like domain-containing protein [Phenylobacterium sp. J367]